jgi:hypothetical protein
MKKLPVCLTLMLCASAALAEPPAPSRGATAALVEQKILAPLRKIEAKRSRFSRAAPVPVERRVRMLDPVALTDARGRAFVRFAIDLRRSFDEAAPWQSDAVLGCAYPGEGEVFVQRDGAFFPASIVLGKEAGERPGVCRPAQEPARGTGG